MHRALCASVQQRSTRVFAAAASSPLAAAALPAMTPCTPATAAVAAVSRSSLQPSRWMSSAPLPQRALRSSAKSTAANSRSVTYYQVSLHRYPLTFLLPHSSESMQRPAPHLRVDAPPHSARPQLAPGSVLLHQPQEWQREEGAVEMDLMRTHMLLKVTKYERAAGVDGAAASASASADDLTVTTSALVLAAQDSVHTLARAAQTLLAPHAGALSSESVSLLAGAPRSLLSLGHPLELARTLLGMAPRSIRGGNHSDMSVVQQDRIIADLFRAGHAALAVTLAPGFTALPSGEIVATPSGVAAAAADASASSSTPVPLLLPLNGGRPVRRAQPNFFEVNRMMLSSLLLGLGIFGALFLASGVDRFRRAQASKQAEQAGLKAGETFLGNVTKNVEAISSSVKAATTPSTPPSNVKVRVTGGGVGAAKQEAKPEVQAKPKVDEDAEASDYEQLQARRKEIIREQLRQRELALKEARK